MVPHVVVVDWLVNSSNPKSKADGSAATSLVSQAGQIQRVVTEAERFLTERNSITNFSDVETNDVNSAFKHITNNARDGS